MSEDSALREDLTAHYRRSADVGDLFAALAKAQATFKPVDREGKNPHFQSRYATLDAAVSATRDGCSANGLAIVQMPGNLGNNVAVTTLLGHVSGQWIESTIYIAPVKFDAQGAGSVITYLRRYALMAMLGLAPEDDDGEAAVRPPERVRRPNQRRVSAFSTGQPLPIETTLAQGFRTEPAKIDAKAPAEITGDDLVHQAWEAADEGSNALERFWKGLRRIDRVKLGEELLADLKDRAADRDQLAELAGEDA